MNCFSERSFTFATFLNDSLHQLPAIESHNYITCHVQGCHIRCLKKIETNKNLLNDVRSMTSRFMALAISANVTCLGW